MKKNLIALSVLAVAVALSSTTVRACGEEAKAAEAKDGKVVAAGAETKGCDKPCCAHASAQVADKNAAQPVGDKPCASSKGCAKKAAATTTAVAKAEPAKDTAKAEPVADPGAQR